MTIEADEIIEVVRIQLGFDQVRLEHRFQEDLAAESADLLNIVAVAEDRWGVVIGEEELADLHTVADLVGVVRQRAPHR
jgi:acyl carrier protein